MELVHPADKECKVCHMWVATKTYNLHTAHQRMIDAARIVAIATAKRSHGVMSEAHFHAKGLPCRKECVA